MGINADLAKAIKAVEATKLEAEIVMMEYMQLRNSEKKKNDKGPNGRV